MDTATRILIVARPGHFRESMVAVLKTLPQVELFLFDVSMSGVFAMVYGVLLVVAGGVPLWLAPRMGVPSHWLTLGSCALVCGPLALVTRQRVKRARAGTDS